MASQALTTVNLYSIDNYTFGLKAAQHEQDASVADRMKRRELEYTESGMRRTADSVLLVHDHGHPHVLLLKLGSSFFKLPGGALVPGEEEDEGIPRLLSAKLAPTVAEFRPDWQVGDLLSTWWRPDFDAVLFPYIPAHVTRPKECKRIFLSPLPEKATLAVPKNMKLVAVPLFELFDNAPRYGNIIATLPSALSRFHFVCN